MVTKKAKAVDLRIRPEDMRIFAAIGNARTLTEASETLKIPLFTASRALKRIESTTKVTLLRRDETGLHLTDAGRQYMEACEAALHAHQAATEVLLARQTEPEGVLKVATPIVFVQNVLSHILSDFLDTHPKIRVEMSLYSGSNHEPSANHDIFMKYGMPKESRYQMKVFPPVRHALFASPGYLAKHARPTHPTEVENHACIGYTDTYHRDCWKFWQKGECFSFIPKFRLSVSDPRSLIQMAIDSAGIAFLPLWLTGKHVETGNLVQVLTDWTMEPISYCALYNGRPRAASKEGAFLNFLGSVVGTSKDPRCAGGDPKELFVHGALERERQPLSPERLVGQVHQPVGKYGPM